MRAEAVNTLEGGKVENDDSSVGAASDQSVIGELELADQGGVALKEDKAVARKRASTDRKKSHRYPLTR